MRLMLCIGPLAGVLGTIAIACSSTPTPPPPDSTLTEFCTDWAAAYCQISLCNFDLDTCESFQTGVCTSFATAAEASGLRQYSQPSGLACVKALQGAFVGSSSSVSAATLASIDTICNDAFVGSQVVQKPCTDTYDCSTGLVCATVPGESSVCGVSSPKTLGDPCADPGDTCTGDSYCAASSLGPTCVATPASGTACSAAIPCGTGDYCAAGTCQALATVGQTCAATSDCVAGLYCDLYPPAACTNGLTFARGSIDCQGIAGSDELPPTTIADAGVADSNPSPTPGDAASGG
jgi:hypothetical protein